MQKQDITTTTRQSCSRSIPRWTKAERDYLWSLAGDYPLEILFNRYRRWAARHGHPRRTDIAISQKLRRHHISIYPIGEYITTGTLCKLLNLTTTTIDRWVYSGALQPIRLQANARRHYKRADVVELARKQPKLFAGTSQENLLLLLEDPELAQRISIQYPTRYTRDARPVVCVETGRTYPSSAAAARTVYVTRECLWEAAKKGTAAGGYHWRFK
jgi:hypothetical protein